jgi:hypothetical protein
MSDVDETGHAATVALDAMRCESRLLGSREADRDLDLDLDRDRVRVRCLPETETADTLGLRPLPSSCRVVGRVGRSRILTVLRSGPGTCLITHVFVAAARHFFRSHGTWPVLLHRRHGLAQSHRSGAGLGLPLLYLRHWCFMCPQSRRQYGHMPLHSPVCLQPPLHTHGRRSRE